MVPFFKSMVRAWSKVPLLTMVKCNMVDHGQPWCHFSKAWSKHGQKYHCWPWSNVPWLTMVSHGDRGQLWCHFSKAWFPWLNHGQPTRPGTSTLSDSWELPTRWRENKNKNFDVIFKLFEFVPSWYHSTTVGLLVFRDHSQTLVRRGPWCKKGEGGLKFLTLVRGGGAEKNHHKFSSKNWVYMLFYYGVDP